MKFSLGKNKKLKSRKAIERLFTDGQSIRKGAVRCVFHMGERCNSHQMGVSVSKRYFKKATDRNRVKRLLRESYRLQQHQLQTETPLEFLFIYQSGKIPDFKHCISLVAGLIKELNKRYPST
ncbi:ribonuclease P protein component [Nonlabens xiamenensis]|uniref:ribonuclease P protein component n=1 Tax=Nonlabens xiamenensis TaxID=2341043 RepID=UPI000F60AD35|nr:ribonuclease P protein component [Nonlabens xiamenensis]